MVPKQPSKIIFCLLFASFAFPFQLTAQTKGDRVVVSANVMTKIHDKRVGKVFSGQIDTVTETEGKWCALSRTKGWLPIQYVMNLDMGERHFSSRIKNNKDDFDAWAIRGMIRFENEDFNSALKDLNESIRLRQSNPVAFNNRGIILNAMGRFPEAMQNLDHAIKLNKKYADAYENRGLVNAALGRYDFAIKDYDEAIELRRTNPWSFINRGSAKNNMGEYKSAKADFMKALKLNKKICDAYVGLSVSCQGEGDLEKASRFAKLAVKRNPQNGLAFNQRGWTYYQSGMFDEAIYDFTQAIRFEPKLYLPYSNRGLCHSENGDFDEAVKDFNRSLKLNPESPISYTNRGAAYMALKKYQKADTDLRKAVKMAPKLPDATNRLAWFLATCPNEKFRSGEEAVKFAEAAVEMSNSKEWSFLDTLAAALAENGEFDKAIEIANKVIELAPEKSKAECKTRLAKFEEKEAVRSDFSKSITESS